MRDFGARAAMAAVRAYQLLLRPLLPPACRFQPSCSEYYRQALMSHGLFRGTWLAARRIGRCHPWHAGGYDPLPAPRLPRPGRTGE
jgi:uncharacterized protein